MPWVFSLVRWDCIIGLVLNRLGNERMANLLLCLCVLKQSIINLYHTTSWYNLLPFYQRTPWTNTNVDSGSHMNALSRELLSLRRWDYIIGLVLNRWGSKCVDNLLLCLYVLKQSILNLFQIGPMNQASLLYYRAPCEWTIQKIKTFIIKHLRK